MALSLYHNSIQTLDLNEFILNIDSKIKSVYDIDGLLNCSTDLRCLANNKTFFIDYLNSELSNDLDLFQIGNRYSSQSFMLFRNEKFYVRVNWWPIIETDNLYYDALIDNFSYNSVHDHNFPLLTVGYKGAYTTRLWEYEHDSTIGFIGEKVEMNFLEQTELNVGKVMFYRPSKDIHKQMMPKELSISINIILDSPLDKMQFLFNENESCIEKILYHPISNNLGSIFKFIEVYNDNETINLLESMTKSKDSFIRLESYKLLYTISKDDNFFKMATDDKDLRISEYAKLYLDGKISY